MDWLPSFLQSPTVKNIGLSLGVFTLCYITTLIVFRLVKHSFKSHLEEYKVPLGTRARRVFATVFGLIGFYVSVHFFEFNNSEIERVFMKVVDIVFIITIALFFIKISEVVRDVLFIRFDISQKNNLTQRKFRTQIAFIHRLVVVLVFIIGASLIMMSFDGVRKVGTSLLASAGIATVIIGLAAQKSISNLLAGFQIAFTQPIRIDDVVIVENEWGKIEEITLTYVVVKIWDDRRMVLPISYFLEKPFQNWTKTTSNLIGTVFLWVDYRFPVDEIRKQLDIILETKDPRGFWDKRIKWVQVTDTSERNMEVRILVTARDAPDAFDLRCVVREEMINFIQQNYPQYLPNQRVILEQKEGKQS